MAKGRRVGITRRSSAPGEAPAVQTERLRNSINWDRPQPLIRLVGSFGGEANDLGHPVMLEFGTAKMAPRPYLRPALKKVMGPAATRIIADQLRHTLGRK